MPTITVTYRKVDRRWNWSALADSSSFYGFGRSLKAAQTEAVKQLTSATRDLAAHVIGGTLFEHVVEHQGTASALVGHAIETRLEAKRRAEEARVATTTAVRKLSEAGYSTKDIGRSLGLSFQRVAQILVENK